MVTDNSIEKLNESYLKFADSLVQSILKPQVYRGTLPEVSAKPKKREVADLLEITERQFEREHLYTGNIQRLPGQYSFDREDVIQLFLKHRRLHGGN